MSFEFHKDRQKYFNQQYQNSKKYIIPFIEGELDSNISVLEIGCGEGGILKAFLKKGCRITGIDLSPNKIENAKKYFEDEIEKGFAEFICRNIYDIDPKKDLNSKFDLIILKDTLEHIHDQEKLLKYNKQFLKPNGKVFIAFPPWQMPFGGHQQMCDHKFLSFLPYFHLLPKKVYAKILKIFREKKIEEFLEIKETGISIERFEKILKRLNYKVEKKLFYFINPNYEIKFNFKPVELSNFISRIPYLRDFFTTTSYYLIKIS